MIIPNSYLKLAVQGIAYGVSCKNQTSITENISEELKEPVILLIIVRLFEFWNSSLHLIVNSCIMNNE